MSTCCPICYRVGLEAPTSSKISGDGAEVVEVQQRFFRLLERYVFVDADGSEVKSDEGENGRNHPTFDLEQYTEFGMVSCRECLQLMESFCDLYNQLKTIELHLNWKLLTLKKIMEGGGRVPSRKYYFQGCIRRESQAKGKIRGCADNLIESINRSRRSLINKCSTKLVKSNAIPKLDIPKCHPRYKERMSVGEVTSEQDNFTEPTEIDFCKLSSHAAVLTDAIESDMNQGDIPSHLLGVKLETSVINPLPELSPQTPAHHDHFEGDDDDDDNIAVGKEPSQLHNHIDEVHVSVNDDNNDSESILSTSSSDDSYWGSDSDGEETSKQNPPCSPGPSIEATGPSRVDYILKCPDCNLTFDKTRTLLCHRKDSKSCSGFYEPTKSVRVDVLVPPENNSSESHDNFTDVYTVINLPQAIFLCEQCDLALYSSKDMGEHKKLHGGFSCNFCDFSDSNALTICKHELQHTTRKPNGRKAKTINSWSSCPRCKFQSPYNRYQRHFVQEHLSLILIKPKCPICKTYVIKDLANQGDFLSHLKSHHEVTNENVLRTCTMADCRAYFLTESQLKHHHQQNHVIWNNTPWGDFPVNELGNCNADTTGNKKDQLEASVSRNGSFWHICKIDNCSKKFYLEADLQQHLKLHGKFPCPFCDAIHSFAPHLAWHEINEHSSHDSTKRKFKYVPRGKGNSLPCPRPNCSFIGNCKAAYIIHHLAEHLGFKDKPTNTCPVCSVSFPVGNSFTTKRTMQSHFDIHHNLDKLEEKKTAQKCVEKDCTAYFLTARQLFQHKRQVHKIKKSYSCPDCNVNFEFRSSLHNHQRKYHKEELTIACTVSGCDHRSKTKVGLDTHIRIKHTNPMSQVQCPECAKPCKGSIGLKFHMVNFHKKDKEIKKWICESCGKVFKDREKLHLHSLSHSGPESWEFMCSVCSKKCLTKGKLAEHMRTHTKEKAYICQICGEKYAHRHNLRNHVNSKHGDQVQDIAKKVHKPNMTSRKGIKRKWNANKGQDKSHTTDSE